MASRNVLEIENAKIIFKNFEGKERKNPKTGKVVNAKGERNFCIVIDNPEEAELMKEDGWNVKSYGVGDEYDMPLYYIPVRINMNGNFPPKIHVYTKKSKELFDADMMKSLDDADFKKVNVRINPRPWDDNGRPAIKAYLREMFILLEEDAWEEEFANSFGPEE